VQPIDGPGGGKPGGRGGLPDLSKIKDTLKGRGNVLGGLKEKLADTKKNIKLPKLQSNKKLPLEYDLSSFTEIYAGDRHGTEPTAHPKHDRTHADFDPFEIPMPTLKAEWSPEDAFAKVCWLVTRVGSPARSRSLVLYVLLSRPLFCSAWLLGDGNDRAGKFCLTKTSPCRCCMPLLAWCRWMRTGMAS
jgi:hypothetical protein